MIALRSFICSVFSCCPLFGQSPSAALRVDASATRATVTDATGESDFRFPAPGKYQLRAAYSNVSRSVSDSVALQVAMQLGATAADLGHGHQCGNLPDLGVVCLTAVTTLGELGLPNDVIRLKAAIPIGGNHA